MLTMFMMFPTLNFLPPGNVPIGSISPVASPTNLLPQGSVPSGSISPGASPGLDVQAEVSAPTGNIGPGAQAPQIGGVAGGGFPTDPGISTLPLSLALVPFGLMAVAVFPPFDRFVVI